VADSPLASVRRALRALGRRFTPPGNRTLIEESGEQRPGPGGAEPPSHAGEIEHIRDGWSGGV
jgi:hypothetical protein